MADQQGVTRKLAAILYADVAGYSRLTGADEEGTHRRVSAYLDAITASIKSHNGTALHFAGDAVLAEFPTVSDALSCAMNVQKDLAECNKDLPDDRKVQFRIGVNLGEVIVDRGEIFGNGVNVAARLESLAEPGGVCISGAAYEQVRDRVKATFADLGDNEVKNISRPVRVWQWTPIATKPNPVADAPFPAKAALSLPDKPSIAVLPFDNMSGDPEQEFFGEGMAEDIITALSRFRSLFVIARNSSFTFKGRSVTVRDVARELGVRYVVEGSVRKAGNRMRITAQLIDAISGINLWADRFDGHLDDVFGFQDDITEKIVVAVEPAILAREREHARRKPPENLDAWDLLQRGLSHFYRVNKEDRAEAIRYFKEAIARDPEFAMPHAYLAFALWASRSVSLEDDEVTKTAAATARASAERAISLDPNEPMAHFALGRLHIFAGEPDLAISEMKSAIAINPNFAFGHHGLGFAYNYAAGQSKRAIPHFDVALRLSPRDPLRWAILMTKSAALRELGRIDEAIVSGQQACQIPDSGFLPHVILAASFAEAGKRAEAQFSLEKARRIQPKLSISFLRRHFTGIHERTWDSLISALEKAGLHA